MDMNPILFQPDSRWLGTSPANDFGMFGAQPTYAIQFAQADAHAASAPGDDPGADAALARDAAPDLASAPPAAAPDGTGGAPTAPATALDPVSAAAVPAATISDPAAPAVATALTPVTLVQGSQPTAPLQDQVLSTNVAAPEPASPVAAAATPAGSSFEDPASLSAPVLAAAGPLVPAITAPVQELIPAIGDGIASTVDGLVTGLTDTVAEATDALPLDALTAAPAAVIGGVTDLVEELPVQDLLGSDPVAGIATLVNLVTVSDVIDLKDAGAPADGSLAGVGAPLDQLLDTLTAEPISPPEVIEDNAGNDAGDVPSGDALLPDLIPDIDLTPGG